MSPNNVSAFPRPETLGNQELLESMGVDPCWNALIEEIVSPGDVVATVSFPNKDIEELQNKASGTLKGMWHVVCHMLYRSGHDPSGQAGQQVALLTGSAPPATIEHSFRERIAQWRDFPFEGLARGTQKFPPRVDDHQFRPL